MPRVPMRARPLLRKKRLRLRRLAGPQAGTCPLLSRKLRNHHGTHDGEGQGGQQNPKRALHGAIMRALASFDEIDKRDG